MGPLFVLLIWGVVGGIAAALGAALLRAATAFLTHGVNAGRQKVVFAATIFPFACLGWAAIVVIFQAVINVGLLHRDMGFGDTATCPLPNGYALLMIDEPDHGIVFNPRTQLANGIVANQSDTVDDVRFLQVEGPYLLGAADSRSDSPSAMQSAHIEPYFLLDARVGRPVRFAALETLRESALRLGIRPKLEPINTVYMRYRYTWFDLVAAALLVLPPLVAAWLLLRWIIRLRRSRISLPQIA